MIVPDGIDRIAYFQRADDKDLLIVNRLHDAGRVNLLAGGDRDGTVAPQAELSKLASTGPEGVANSR